MRAVADTDCVSAAATPVISKPVVKETTTTSVARAERRQIVAPVDPSRSAPANIELTGRKFAHLSSLKLPHP